MRGVSWIKRRDTSSESNRGDTWKMSGRGLAMTSARDDSRPRWPPRSAIIKRTPQKPYVTFQLELEAKKQQQKQKQHQTAPLYTSSKQPTNQLHQTESFAKIDPSSKLSSETGCSRLNCPFRVCRLSSAHHQVRRRRRPRSCWPSACSQLIPFAVAQILICQTSLLSILVGPTDCQLSNEVGRAKQAPDLVLAHASAYQRARPSRSLSDRQLVLLAPMPSPLSLFSPNGSPIKGDKQIIQLAQTNPSSFVLNGQQQQQPSPDAPKLIPLSALDRYQEGADLRLFCSASAPKSAGRLHFEWRRNQNELLLGDASSRRQPHQGGSDLAPDAETLAGRQDDDNDDAGGLSSRPAAGSNGRVRISMMDESASLLRITQLEADDSGNYTCLARNQHGFDSSTVRVNVMVKLKWIVEPPSEMRVRAGRFVQLECDASGQPTPLISWTSLKDHQTINSKVLRIDRVSTNDSGLYECRASGGASLGLSQQRRDQSPGEQLRKLVRLIVNGK